MTTESFPCSSQENFRCKLSPNFEILHIGIDYRKLHIVTAVAPSVSAGLSCGFSVEMLSSPRSSTNIRQSLSNRQNNKCQYEHYHQSSQIHM